MQGKMVDLIEDLNMGVNMEQLAPKPVKGGKEDGTAGANSKENRK